ncbi:MAG: hypothetical protein AB2766_12705 [Candidatus Thiodiazotropha endolucinida]
MSNSHTRKPTSTSRYTSLTPVDNADIENSYGEALRFAIENPDINNIAITGPYGSGKSSIIKSFEKKNNKYNFLKISLASFKDQDVEILKIERSILQQMLYGADAKKLPYSRFKVISTPEYPLLKSLMFLVWILSAYFAFRDGEKFFNVTPVSFDWFVGLVFLIYFISFTVFAIESIYKKTFGFQLKKFSLKNAEIETGDIPESSILNRHLDEIIYFFQVTDYHVVVIEDLDRFGNPEIFVKLREINKLVNDNAKINRQVKFLYALKDDMFAHKNRAKFFDFIIPVIPIINSSNSLDKMQERIGDIDISKSIESQFLREVSLYIDDFRLLHNIFNEFVIYYDILDSESMNATKLLAMIIYKNVYPNDFENLHYSKGVLYTICDSKTKYIIKRRKELGDKVNKLRDEIRLIENEKTRNIDELIYTYIGWIVAHNDHAMGVMLNNLRIPFTQLRSFEEFKKITNLNPIIIYNQQNTRVNTSTSFQEIEEEINPGISFLERKDIIDNAAERKNREQNREVRDIEKKISDLPKHSLSYLLQETEISIDNIEDELDKTDLRLLLYLVKNGYLDENYHLYISNFYEGRLTKKDRNFLITIRNFSQPDPHLMIDTPKEVCANMRPEDFGQKYVLNVNLIDYLLSAKQNAKEEIRSVMQYISENYELTASFLSTYYDTGTQVEDFIQHLCSAWPGYAQAIIESGENINHLLYVLIYVNPEYIHDKMNDNGILTSYLSDQGAKLLSPGDYHINDYSFLEKLDVRFHDLEDIALNKSVIDIAHKKSLYLINTNNIETIYNTYADKNKITETDLKNCNYTSIILAGTDQLKVYIRNNIEEYISNVFLAIDTNTCESVETLKELINNVHIRDDLKERIILSQDYVFSSINEVPDIYWKAMISKNKVFISWDNIAEYVSHENIDQDILTSVLNQRTNAEELSKQKYLVNDKGEKLSIFIVNNDNIDDLIYNILLANHPYNYKDFPSNVSHEKLIILAVNRIVGLNTESYYTASDNDELLAVLIEKNLDNYFKNKDEFVINDTVRESLLESSIDFHYKISISMDVTSTGIEERATLSSRMTDILLLEEARMSDYEFTVLSKVLEQEKRIEKSIKLLTKCIQTWDEEQTMQTLSLLPHPYNKISEYGKRPKLMNNEINTRFVSLLHDKGYISSFEVGISTITVNTYNSQDH